MKQLFLVVLFLSSINAFGQNFPQPSNPPILVNDFEQALNHQQLDLLENKLRNHSDTTTSEIVVVIIGSTGEYDIRQYGAQLAEKWAIGDSKEEKGVLLLVAMGDQTVSITTGYGLESMISDVDSKRLIDSYIVPNFKVGRYFEGIDQTTSLLMAMASGDFEATPSQESSLVMPFLALVFVIWLIWNLSRLGQRRRQSYGSRPLSLLMLGGINSSRGRDFDNFSGGSGRFGGDRVGGGGTSGSW